MKIQEYKQQKQIKDKEHEQRSIKYKNITRQRNTFKVYMHVNKHNGRKYSYTAGRRTDGRHQHT